MVVQSVFLWCLPKASEAPIHRCSIKNLLKTCHKVHKKVVICRL